MTPRFKTSAFLTALFIGAAVLVSGQVKAETFHKPVQIAAADAKKKRDPGKRLYGPRGGLGCIACHGRNGAKAIKDYPNIAGQDAKYIENQIEDIMEGKRVASVDPADGKPRTSGMKGALLTPDGKPRMTKEEIKQVAKWLSGLEPAVVKQAEPLDPANVEAGEKLFKKYKCKNCHGKEGKKPLRSYPVIAGQKVAYLVNQLNDFRNKVRDNGKSKTMFAFVRKIKDDEVQQIAEYLSQVKR